MEHGGESWPAFDAARPIAIIGAGVIGSKVAWACARAGIRTSIFDLVTDRAARARETALRQSAPAEAEVLAERLSVATSLADAADGAQLAFENVPERLELKLSVLGEVGRFMGSEAYMGSNTSSLLCTPLARASGRPRRFFNLNFSDPLTSPFVELMGGEETDPQTRQFARDWARAMGLVVIEVRQEQMGYSFNRLWRVIKREALRQADQGVSTPQDIDRAWMLSFQSDIGPFGIMDEVGLGTVLAIEEAYYGSTHDAADKPPAMLRNMVERGALGAAAGRGFYAYPDPEFRQHGFLSGRER
jgi:3-hydroxybutyryl-CoA dehydrogenase